MHSPFFQRRIRGSGSRAVSALAALALAILYATPAFAQDTATQDTRSQTGIQRLRLNVYLGEWQVLGPLPLEANGTEGLKHEYFENEAQFRGGNARFYRDRLHTWKSVDTRLVDLRRVLADDVGGENCVGYAWTQFVSDKDQKLRLALAHDDMAAVWINQKLVDYSTMTQPSALDQAIYEVDVKKGVNTLLLKVHNNSKEWDFAVRFLPLDVRAPLLSFKCMPDRYRSEFPVVGIEILDQAGKSLARHLCSGTRINWYVDGTFYRLYAEPPAGAPYSVRLIARHPGFVDFSQTYSWEEAISGLIEVEFSSDQPLRLAVLDAASGRPVQGIVVWDQNEPRSPVAESNGIVAFPDFQPTISECWVSAPGYLAKNVKLDWPRRKTHKVLLSPGGCTLSGQVLSESGKPVANALVIAKANSHPSFQPRFQTDANGRFRIHGFDEKKPSFKAEVSARGYVTNKSYTFSVSKDNPTNVTFNLAEGVLVTGKVTHAKTGRPIPGMEVFGGDSRYARNKATSKTDKNGVYELVTNQPDTLTLTALSNRYAPAMKSITTKRGAANKVDLQVSDGQTIRGIVKDSKGQPISSARVRVDSWSGKRVFTREVRSNSSGEFVFSHMPEADMEAYVRMDGYIPIRSFELVANQLAEVTLRQQVNYTFRVTGGGKVVPGLSITQGYKFTGQDSYSWQSSSSAMRSYTASTGQFTTSVNESTDYTNAYRFVANGFEETVVGIPADASESKTVEVELKPAKQFTGMVVDAKTGQPKPGVAVTLVSESSSLQSSSGTVWQHMTGQRYSGTYATTDANGMFQLSVPPPAKKVELVLASPDGGFHQVSNLPDAMFQSEDGPITVPFPQSGTIQGTYAIDGKPIANQSIRIAWSPSQTPYNGQFFQAATQTTTDVDGKFQTVKLSPGRYQISRVMSFQSGDSMTHNSYVGNDSVILLPDETKAHVIDVPKGFSVNGVATDPDGNPVPLAMIYASGQNGIEAVAMSDSKGEFKLEHLSAGTFNLRASHYARDENGSYRSKYQGNETLQVIASIDDFEFELQDSSNRPVFYQQPQAQSAAGTIAPKFQLTTVNPAATYDSDKLIGKVVAVCFWYSQAKDVSAIQKVYEQYKDNPEVVFLSVCSGTNLEDAQAVMKQSKADFPMAFVDQSSGASQLQYLLGVQNGQGCVVIDRDGRFVGQATQAALATTIQTALGKAKSSTKTAQLEVRASAGESSMPVSGAKLMMRVYDSTFRVVAEDKYTNHVLQDLTWHYPAIGAGGKLIVTISGQGIQKQTELIEDPRDIEQMTLDIPAPRKISGRVTDQDGKPVPDMKVMIYGFISGIYTATTDASGSYTVGCFPGQYQLMPQSNDKLAFAQTDGQVLTVGADKDPRAQNFKASTATTIQGKLLDAAGNPATSGTIMVGSSTRVDVGSDGTFTLPGVASVGRTRVVAMVNDQYGMIWVQNPTTDQSYDIQIGKGFEDTVSAAVTSSIATPFDLQTLDGNPVQWEPPKSGNQCLLFCGLWHPRTPELIAAAKAEAEKNNAKFQLISVDFSREQAVREAARLKLTDVLYAGPNGLTLPDEWKLSADHQCVVVSADGKFVSKPQLVKQ